MKPSISLTDFFFRIFPPTAGGFLGTGIFLLVFALLQSPASANADNFVFSSFAVLAIAFVGAISANILAVFFATLANPDRYLKEDRNSLIIDTLFVSVLLYIVIIPFVLVSDNNALSIVGFYFIFSVMVSGLVIERFVRNVSIFESGAVAFAGFLLTLIFMQLFEIGGSVMLVILLFILPMSWFIVSVFMTLGELIGGFIKIGK